MDDEQVINSLDARLRSLARRKAARGCEVPDYYQVGRLAALRKLRKTKANVDPQLRNYWLLRAAGQAMARYGRRACNRTPPVEIRPEDVALPEPEPPSVWVRVRMPERVVDAARKAATADVRRLDFHRLVSLAVDEFLRGAEIASPD